MSDTTFRAINTGGTFYLDQHPGNQYRKTSEDTAEFTQHRLGNQFVGCRVGAYPSMQVSLVPIDPSDLELL